MDIARKTIVCFIKKCYNESINKLDWLKQKKVLFIALAVVFVVALFLTKNKTIFKNQAQGGLVYSGNETVGDLISRDTDLDGVTDWEEGLFGTDPTKKDTNDDGIPDNIEIAKRRGQNIENGELNLSINNSENLNNLSQTDLLSRELFSTVAALNQAGAIDQSTIDKLSETIIQQVNNSGTGKTFIYSDLKVVKADTVQAITKYNNTLGSIYQKYPMKYTVLDVLQKFVIDEENVDESVLPQLDPIIKQTNSIISEMAKMEVPESLTFLHLDVLNALQKLSENISTIRLYSTDPVIALGGISQYQTSAYNFELSVSKLANQVETRLK